MHKRGLTLTLAALWAAFFVFGLSARSQAAQVEIQLLDRNGNPAAQIVDGDMIRLRAAVPQKAASPQTVTFWLEPGGAQVGECSLPEGKSECSTASFASLGWYWLPDGNAAPTRTIRVELSGAAQDGSLEIHVTPRPVVMVHGFSSSWEAWLSYLGPQGYLAADGIAGFAVGDGRGQGTLNTGLISNPSLHTNTIAENAAIMGKYIDSVKAATGAQMVDLVAHSMGGLISRYYIDRVMQGRDVAQLIMIGSPMAGTDCSILPSSLGIYMPAVLEIRPSYVTGIFNPQITHRHGVPFYALAGVPIQEQFKSPCTRVPSDLVVDAASVEAIPLQTGELPIIHTDLNVSPEVYQQFIRPLLTTPAGGFVDAADQPPAGQDQAPALQFTRVYTGHVSPGESDGLTIPIEPGVSVAGFALFDLTHSISVTVQGASGNVITLSPDLNGLVVVEDPTTLFYLGYGFQNPKPGLWKVTLEATGQTPAAGADYAISAYLQGDAVLNTTASTLLPQVGESVRLSGDLRITGQAVPPGEVEIIIHGPQGDENLPAEKTGQGFSAEWTPTSNGLYGIDVRVQALSPDGTQVERSAFLTVEAQPRAQNFVGLWTVLGLIGLALFAGLFLALRRRLRRPRAGEV